MHRFRKDVHLLQYESVFGHRTRRKTNPDGHVYVIPYNIHNIPFIFIDLYIMYVLYFIIYYDTLAISYSHHRWCTDCYDQRILHYIVFYIFLHNYGLLLRARVVIITASPNVQEKHARGRAWTGGIKNGLFVYLYISCL